MYKKLYFWSIVDTPNYAFKPIAEQSLRSNWTIAPQRLNAALGPKPNLVQGETMMSRFLEVSNVMSENDGSLPDIDFDFGEERIASRAYLAVSQFASCIASEGPSYWSPSPSLDIPIVFGDNPAEVLLAGDAESFHLVFGGMLSSKSCSIPDLGLFVLGPSQVSLNYKMGPEWNSGAIEGLFEIMHELVEISENVQVSHSGNVFDQENILLVAFREWLGEQRRGA